MNILEQTINELSTYFLTRDAWRDWTPTVDQNGAVAATVTYARYAVLAQTVVLIAHLNITGAGVAGNQITVSGIPSAIQPTHTDAQGFYPFGWMSIADFGTATYHGVVVPTAADILKFRQATTGFVGANPNFALANNDEISFTATYER